MYDVVVVGGGITGLAAAHALRDRAGVLLLEGSPVLGGKLRSTELGGMTLDDGAEQILVRQPAALDLIRAVGLGDDIVHPRTSSAAVWTRGALRPLPGGTVLGVPTDPGSLARSGVLSPGGLLRAAADLGLPRTTFGDDVAVGAYVGARVGREVVDRLVDPLLGGVYAGRADALSLAATVPQLAVQVQRHRTLLGAARAARAETATSDAPVFAGLVGGLGRLPAAVADALRADGVEVRTEAMVRRVDSGPDGFRLITGPVPAEQQIDTRCIVIAVPAAPAARLLEHVAPAAAAEIAGVEYASVVTVTLGYRGQPAALRGSGFLIPAVERRVTKAVTYMSEKWAHLTGDHTFVRGSVGRHGEERDIQRDDGDLVAAVHADLAAASGIQTEPVLSRVNRWGGGLPQYAPGHLDRVRRVRAALPPGIVVCGAAYDGVGVPACVRSGQLAAGMLREWSRDRADQGEGA